MSLRDEIICNEIKKYFGSRYSDEYHPNPATGEEFNKLKQLILTCIKQTKRL